MTTQAATTGVRTRTRPRRALDIQEATVEVTRSGYGMEPDSVERIRIPKIEGPVAYVRVEGSITRNMGDYNSIRVAVMVEVPCYPSEGEIDRAYAFASAKVDQKCAAELSIATGTAVAPR